MLEAGGKAGVLQTEEVKMIKNVFEFTDLTTEDVMTPRNYIFGLNGELTLSDAKEELFKATYSRIPVYNDNIDNVTGILYRHQALKELAQGNQSSLLKDLARPPLFVPEAKPADALLKQFQQEKRHIAMVVNEFGGVIGLVTTEDLLEEVVGEILDETDITEELIKRIGKNRILVSGRTEVRKINEFLKVELDEEEQNTISGLIQQELGHIPSIGEELRVDGCLLIVRDADEKSIKSVQIQKVEEVVQETHKENEDPSPALPLD
jgi:CBS domain containing-hemolysin-like protein